MLRNVLVIAGAILISSSYLWLSPRLVPEKYALVANFIVMPSVLGLLAGYLFAGRLPLKLGLLLLVPIAHVLVFGRDPAKPGLENVVALVELAPLWIGCVVAHIVLQKKARSAAAQNRPR
jgi:hypothetical protein